MSRPQQDSAGPVIDVEEPEEEEEEQSIYDILGNTEFDAEDDGEEDADWTLDSERRLREPPGVRSARRQSIRRRIRNLLEEGTTIPQDSEDDDDEEDEDIFLDLDEVEDVEEDGS